MQTVQPAGRETFAKITEQYYRLPSIGDQPGRMVHKGFNAKVWELILKLRFGCPKVLKSVAEERGVCRIYATPPHSTIPSTMDEDRSGDSEGGRPRGRRI